MFRSLAIPIQRKPLIHCLGLWWLVLALVLAPALGRIHLVVHLPVELGVQSATAQEHGLGALFAGHSSADCRLFDQLTHGGSPATEWPALALAPVPACPPAPAAQPLLPRAALPFQARAPPVA